MSGIDETHLLLDLGLQPVSNRYLQSLKQSEEYFVLKLGQNYSNGQIQLIDPFPQHELKPRYDWITYNEPEAHLDHLVEALSRTIPDKKKAVVGGVSFKDDSTLERFSSLGYQTWRIDVENDLSLEGHMGIESVQGSLNRRTAEIIKEKYGEAECLIVRHIWEHVYNQSEFASAISLLLSDKGRVVFEVPDCTRLLKSGDCTMIWEEHLYYYTPSTIVHSLEANGFEVLDTEIVPYPGENSIIVIAKSGAKRGVYVDSENSMEQIDLGRRYVEGFRQSKIKIHDYLLGQNCTRGVAIFGAGHSACGFTSFMELENHISVFVDDDKNKKGLYMPKSKRPIVSSDQFRVDDYSLVLMAVNPQVEDIVMAKIKQKSNGQTKIGSIFPFSQNYLF
jgi:hypothetical protein